MPVSESSDPSDLEFWTIRASASGYDETYDDGDRRDFLAWLAAEKAKWQAEGAVSALRQAANLAEPFSGAALPSSPSRPMFADWLRDRADRIEKGSDDDR